jgi:GNAT superfamily N-acetyltransferase
MTPDGGVRYRPAAEGDLADCEEVWREAINDYTVPMGQHEIPPDSPSVRALHAHALATDPSRFWVATVTSADGTAPSETVIGFASAVRRGSVWFLSMLFVRPGFQRGGIGRELLARCLPDPAEDLALATATDAAQPISNGLYAQLGMVPRVPMFNLVGRPVRAEALPTLPDGIQAIPFEATGPMERDRGLAAELAAEIGTLDREVLGFAHPEDHDYLQRAGRIGYTYRDESGVLQGYGYTSALGRVGPIAVRDPALHAPIAGDLLRAVTPRGASAIWVPGQAGPTTEALLKSGLRIEGFPVLIGWSRPFADFSRYLPISPGLL